MAKGMDGGGSPPRDDDDDPFGARSAAALAEADDSTLLALGTTLLAELKDRDLLRLVLRNRTDSATVVEVEAIGGGDEEEGIELIAAGYHAETPEGYEGWVEQADALHAALARRGLSDEDAEGLLAGAADEALLLAFDRAREEEDDDDAPEGAPGTEGGGDIGARLAVELIRRGVIEPDADAAP